MLSNYTTSHLNCLLNFVGLRWRGRNEMLLVDQSRKADYNSTIFFSTKLIYKIYSVHKKMEIPTRLYPQKFPDIGDTVITEITRIEKYYIFCHLLEYDCEGMVPFNELSKHKKYSVKQLTSIGRKEYMNVMSVDKNKGYIDLSKIDVSESNQSLCAKRYALTKKIHALFTRLSQNLGVDLITNLLWKHYDETENNVYIAMYNDRTWQNTVDNKYRYIARFEMVCYDSNAIGRIKDAIEKGLECSTENIQMQFVYTGKDRSTNDLMSGNKPKSLYEFTVVSISPKEEIIETLQMAVDAVQKSISPYKSEFNVISIY
jgi:translation initiation factor 2 alpha subunit (eIF-2alpha)